jgi:5-methyltetrahydrofolate--homocysteine methyltransferase
MGTRLIALGLDLARDDPSLWNLSRPADVAGIHLRDIAAGSDALLTNTFGANRVWLDRYGRAGLVAEVNRRAVALAREAAGTRRFVLGSIGPTASGRAGAYREQAECLADAGADALLFETHQVEEAVMALDEVRESIGIPRLVSLVAWPEALSEAVRRLEDRGASSLGANCQIGVEPALELAEKLRQHTALPLILKPSAGKPGEAPFGPESFALAGPRLRELRPVLVGGCCGTTEAHVAALRAACYHAVPTREP